MWSSFTMNSEAMILKCNDFNKHITESFRILREKAVFSDVTLVCEDYQEFEAHRTLLAAFSPLFSQILKITKHSHPLIFMRGTNSEDLGNVLDYIYHGEVRVGKKDLDNFFALVTELQIEGLMEKYQENITTQHIDQNAGILVDLVKVEKSPFKEDTTESRFEMKVPDENGILFESEGDKKVNDEFQSSEELDEVELNKTNKIEYDVFEDACDEQDRNETKKPGQKKVYGDKRYLNVYIDDQHGKEGMFSCNLCKNVSSTMKKVKSHLIRVHTIGAQYKCELCHRDFVYQSDMEKHMLVHKEDKPFMCNLCGAYFKSKIYITQHVQHVHGTDEERKALKKFICTICSKRLQSMHILREHERTHGKKKDILCTQCGKGFNTKGELRKHIRFNHEGQIPREKTEEEKVKNRAYQIEWRAHKRAQNGGVVKNEEKRRQFNEYMRQWNAKNRLRKMETEQS